MKKRILILILFLINIICTGRVFATSDYSCMYTYFSRDDDLKIIISFHLSGDNFRVTSIQTFIPHDDTCSGGECKFNAKGHNIKESSGFKCPHAIEYNRDTKELIWVTKEEAASSTKILFRKRGDNYYDLKSTSLTPCSAYNAYKSCAASKDYACVWNETKYGNYCNIDNLMYVYCGDAYDIPYQVPALLSFTVNFLKIVTPIILIIVSIINLLKALAASKEDEIKKAQNSLIKKLVSAVLIFFIISIVQFVILKVSDSTEEKNITDCMSCMLNNKCEKNIYYKTNVGGKNSCRYINGDVFSCDDDTKDLKADKENNSTSGNSNGSNTHLTEGGHEVSGSSGNSNGSNTHLTEGGHSHGGHSGKF